MSALLPLIGWIVAILAAIYLVFCGFLYFTQRSVLYQPPAGAPAISSEEVTVEARRARVKVSTQRVTGTRALIYFGGNAEDVSRNLPTFSLIFARRSLFLMHYRGYGNSTGKPREQAFLADGLALFDLVHQTFDDVVVVGRSLGSGVAVHVAAQRPVASLVLITPFDSVLRLVESRFSFVPVSWLLKDRFESWRRAPKVVAPTLLIAAGKDEVVPLERTVELLKAFGPDIARLEVLPDAGHNDVSESVEFATLLRTIRIHLPHELPAGTRK